MIDPNWSAHLRDAFERAKPVLFTGAGFSLGARNVRGAPLPDASQLRKDLWSLCFPSADFDSSATLQDLYETALQTHPRQLTELLVGSLSVDVATLPDWYAKLLSMPWNRAYTLNVDNLASAAAQKYDLGRRVLEVSGTALGKAVMGGSTDLEVIHLNGTIGDVPNSITFSLTQYADRMATPDPAYTQFLSDFLSSPIVFVGTRLDEPPLWQHIAMRQGRGGRELLELRQRSFLVVPTLDRARQALLSKFNVVWLPMSGEEFTRDVLGSFREAREKGLIFLKSIKAGSDQGSPLLAEVSDLAGEIAEGSEFLIGHEPRWGDLRRGRAIEREADDSVWAVAQEMLAAPNGEARGLLLLSGTAGSGKSTSLMRLALRLSTEGKRVAWLDRNMDSSPRAIGAAMKAEDGPPVLAIDDADNLGSALAPLLRDIALAESHPLVLLAIRAGKVDRVLTPQLGEGLPFREISMPLLEDSDIGKLIDVMGRERRLGALTGKPRREQEAAFKEQAGYQLLVAMYQATSGFKFEEKACREVEDLEPESRLVYGVIAVASAHRFGLTRDELLVATRETSNERLNAINALLTRHVVVQRSDGSIWARHRVIAEIIQDDLLKNGRLATPVSGLALLAASKVRQSMRRSARPWRLLRAMTNNDHLYRVGGLEFARKLYGELELVIPWDYHLWLQRGSLEVKEGDLKQAEFYLLTARGLAPNDPFVETEWAYLLFKKAINVPMMNPELLVNEATTMLEDLIRRRRDYYPYHILSTQGLAWARRHLRGEAKAKYLKGILDRAEEGHRRFPSEKYLEEIHEGIRREYLGLAVNR